MMSADEIAESVPVVLAMKEPARDVQGVSMNVRSSLIVLLYTTGSYVVECKMLFSSILNLFLLL